MQIVRQCGLYADIFTPRAEGPPASGDDSGHFQPFPLWNCPIPSSRNALCHHYAIRGRYDSHTFRKTIHTFNATHIFH